jgi:hypothetical protein
MQTFITDINIIQSAKNLDNKRLGKQRVEAIQIANNLLIKPNRWKNHPAVKMWDGYIEFLIYYLTIHICEWHNRGFKNNKCLIHLQNLSSKIKNKVVKPNWLTEEFIESHRSNLIRKKPEYYRPLFPNTREGLSYIWPV